MKKYKKLILWVSVADLLLLMVLFVLCAVADSIRAGEKDRKSICMVIQVKRTTPV